jgi:hypothetical protein
VKIDPKQIRQITGPVTSATDLHRYYPGVPVVGAAWGATQTLAADTVYLSPLLLETPMPITALACRVAHTLAYPSLSLISGPAWLSLVDQGHGTAFLSGTPGAGDVGTVSVTIRATDGVGGYVDQTFDLSVAEAPPVDPPANVAPVFTSSPVVSATEGDAYAYEITASDADSDPLTIAAPTLPAWLTLTDHGNGTATLSGTPPYCDSAQAVVLRVSDGTETVDQPFFVAVTPLAYSIAITSEPPIAEPGAAYVYTVTTEASGGTAAKTITATTLPAWASLVDHGDGTATISGAAPVAAGSHPVAVRAVYGTAFSEMAGAVTVRNVAPVFTSTPVTSALYNVAYSYNVTATDANGTAPALTLLAGPGWLALTDHGNGTATLSGTSATTGSFSVTLLASDGLNLVQQSFTVVVTNTAPTFTSTAPTTGNVGVVYTYNITATDAEGNAITITAQAKPSWATFTNNGNGTATLTGTPTATGNASVTLTASDGLASTNQSFTIVVSA